MSDKFQEIEFGQVKWLVITSYLFAIILNIIAIQDPLLTFLPPFGLLLVLFWSVQLLRNSHLITAFILGVLYDALYQTLLGGHALLFVIITFIMLRIRLRFRTYRHWQQGLVVGFYFYIYQILHYFFFSPVLEGQVLFLYWIMPIIAGIIWPGLVVTLRGLSNRLSTL